jgi:hypothetical protein
MNEVLVLYNWVTTKLKNDPTIRDAVQGRVYSDVAPAGSRYPLIVAAIQSVVDVSYFGARPPRSHVRAVMLIRAIDDTDTWSRVVPLDQAIHADINGGFATTSYGRIWGASASNLP